MVLDIHVSMGGEVPPSPSYPDLGFILFFRNRFPGLFQDFSRTLNFTPKISMLILLTVCHTFHIFYSSLTDFQHFPGPVAFFQDFPVLENATMKFQDFPGFPGPVQTLLTRFKTKITDFPSMFKTEF